MFNKYTVTIIKTERGTVNVVAETEDEAQVKATYLYKYCPSEIHWVEERVENDKVRAFRCGDNCSNDITKQPKSYLGKGTIVNDTKKTPVETPESSTQKNDAVNHPSHYQGGIECIEAMRIQFGDEAVYHFCQLNAFKYLWRTGKKGDAEEDIEKAKWYTDYSKKLKF